MDKDKFIIRKAKLDDLDDIKSIVDSEKSIFGFITRGTIKAAVISNNIFVAEYKGRIVGFQHYYHRKSDGQTTLYKKAVIEEFRNLGIGSSLVKAVIDEAKKIGKLKIKLKCPVGLAANTFHKKMGFHLKYREKGKKRELNVYEYDLIGNSND